MSITTSVIGPAGFYWQECPQLFYLRKIWFTVTSVNSTFYYYILIRILSTGFMHEYAWMLTYIQDSHCN